jgi:2-methylcitrate dehydratase MmgE/PrpD-like protein
VLTRDGRTLDREQLVNRGSLADPMSWAELEHKFRANVSGRIDPAAADAAVAAIASLEKQPTVTGLGEALLGDRARARLD